MRTQKEKLTYMLTAIAAVLYSSWPLGYLLNPNVARSSLASGLEAVHQPYNWVFVMTDVVSGMLVIAVCWLLWNQHKTKNTAKALSISLTCTALFALGTIIDALLPERCVPNLMVCPSFTQDHTLLVHGIFSILASLFLFFALFVPWLKQHTNPTLTVLLVGYVVFGVISLVQAVIPSERGNWSQDYYMTLCSAWLLLLPYATKVLNRTLQPVRVKK